MNATSPAERRAAIAAIRADQAQAAIDDANRAAPFGVWHGEPNRPTLAEWKASRSTTSTGLLPVDGRHGTAPVPATFSDGPAPSDGDLSIPPADGSPQASTGTAAGAGHVLADGPSAVREAPTLETTPELPMGEGAAHRSPHRSPHRFVATVGATP
jgi:hypothetical protein